MDAERGKCSEDIYVICWLGGLVELHFARGLVYH